MKTRHKNITSRLPMIAMVLAFICVSTTYHAIATDSVLKPFLLGRIPQFDAGYDYELLSSDLDGDGTDEILLRPNSASWIQIGTIRPGSMTVGPKLEIAEHSRGLAVGKLRSDVGANVLTLGEGVVTIYKRSASGEALVVDTIFSAVIGNQIYIADLQGSDDAEIAVLQPGGLVINGSTGTYVPAKLAVYALNADGGYTLMATHALGINTQVVSFKDVNGDGKLDVLFKADYESPNSITLINNGIGGFTRTGLVEGDTHRALHATDLDGDGKLDLIASFGIPFINGGNTPDFFPPDWVHFGQNATSYTTGVNIPGTGGTDDYTRLIGFGRFLPDQGFDSTVVWATTTSEIRIIEPSAAGQRDLQVRRRFSVPQKCVAATIMKNINKPDQIVWLCERGLLHVAKSDPATVGLQPMRITDIRVRSGLTPPPMTPGSGYQIHATSKERRLLFNGHHFATIMADAGLILRPRPGFSVNGWGGTVYYAAFLPGAVLRPCSIETLTTTADGVRVVASGQVFRGASSSHGTWRFEMSFAYDVTAKEITGTGKYDITLSGPLSSDTGDLNLCKLANNVLVGVPTYSGRTITGDMTSARATSPNGVVLTWDILAHPGYYPGDRMTDMLIEVSGALNNVKTAAMGLCPIQVAAKPSINIGYKSLNGIPFIFGAAFTTSLSTNPYSDSIGITPLVVWGDTQATQFSYNITFQSKAIPEDGDAVHVDLSAEYLLASNPPPALDVYWSESITGPYELMVGSIWRVDSQTGQYIGTVQVPQAMVTDGRKGFFIAKPTCQ